MLKKLLLALLVLCLLPCAYAEEPSVHIIDLTDMTLLTSSTPDVSEAFLRLCPEADAETVRCITPEYAFLQYGLSSTEVYAAPDGTTWALKGDNIFRMTDPGCRVTSIHPVTLKIVSYWQSDKGLLYTQQRDGETDVLCLNLQTGEIETLLTTQGSLVIAAPDLSYTLAGYTPLPDYSDLLLCTAQITQADASDPALSITLEKVVGDITYNGDAGTESAYKAAVHPGCHVVIEYGDARADSLEAFAAIYREMYPDHNLSNPTGDICDRTYLTGNPAHGRLYEVTFSNKIFLWKDGQAHLLSDCLGTPNFINGLEAAIWFDLNGDGTEELVCVFTAGSGLFCHIAATYDPVNRTGMKLYTSLVDDATDELHLRLEDGACRLYKGDVLLGTVTEHGLSKPEGTPSTMYGLTLLDENDSLSVALANPVDEEAFLALVEASASPAAFAEAGLLTHLMRISDVVEFYASAVRTQSTLYTLAFLPVSDTDWILACNSLPLNHDRSALEAIQPGMTLDEVRLISPDEAQFPFLLTGASVTAVSTHVLPTGEVLTVVYEFTDGDYVVVSAEWDAL